MKEAKSYSMSCCAARRSNKFIVGLTTNSPLDTPPILWDYTLCGQYRAAVPAGATIPVYCLSIWQFRYVIVHFPITDDRMNFCELEVLVRGMTKVFIATGAYDNFICTSVCQYR